MKGPLKALLVLALSAGTLEAAEGPETQRKIPDIPSGPGVIQGRVVHEDANQSTADLDIGLYALAPDGQPSLRETQTNADGGFRFESISNAPRTLYLVGTRYQDIPYGKRVSFQPDTKVIDVVIEVDEPTFDTGGLRFEESRVEFRWRGDRLVVSESHQVENSGDRVVRVDAGEKTTPVFEVVLPPSAQAFTPALGHRPEHFERRDGRVLYWGPIHRGDNVIAFSYILDSQPGPDGPPIVRYRPRNTPASETLLLMVPEDDPEPSAQGFEPGTPITTPRGSFRTYTAPSSRDPSALEFVVTAPAQRSDPALLTLAKADVVLELDDSALDVRVIYALEVAGPTPLIGNPETPLLELEVPEGAELLGLAPAPEEVGAVDQGDGRIAILGPLPQGDSSLSVHLRFPSTPQGAEIDLGFPRKLPLLNVLVADTGVRVQSDRLHRRRPMRMGTRLYLYREAFDVAAGERLPLRLERVQRGSLPRTLTRAAVLGFAALGLVFMLAPLQGSERSRGTPPEEDRARSEREALYEAIRDLEHDFETGKLGETERVQLRQEIEARAAELIARENRAGATAPSHCPACQAELEASWTFCAHCGASL